MEELAKRLVELSDKLGPHVVEAARGAATMEAYSSIQGHIIGLLFAALAVYVGRWCWIKNVTDDTGIPFGRIGACFLFMIAGIAATACVGGLTDPWLWGTLNNPDLWIAKKVLKL